METVCKNYVPITHNEILNRLLGELKEVDFRSLAKLEEDEKVQRKHYLVHTIDEILKAAEANGWQICRNNGQAFVYNGAYWKPIDRELLQDFFGRAAAILGVPKVDARFYPFRRDLILQFDAEAILPPPEKEEGVTLINLLNGTFEINRKGQQLREPRPEDFISYQLPFNYDPLSRAPTFEVFLNRILPDKEKQKVLQEYLGYVFISSKRLKLEKVLLLYGSGANGKSVFIEIVAAMLGSENVSRYSLESVTNNNGYSRAELGTKLLNLSSEISGKMNNDFFKQLASGESVEARYIYGRPFTMESYAKLMFSTNELPKEVEQTNGYFRRWLIIPFDETIPEEEQDKELSHKIIDKELSGVFNWVLEGLQRLLIQKRFSHCEAISNQIQNYRRQSDSVALFIEEDGLKPCHSSHIPLKEVYFRYKCFCLDNGYRTCSNTTFSERLKKLNFEVKRLSLGNVVYCNFLNINLKAA